MVSRGANRPSALTRLATVALLITVGAVAAPAPAHADSIRDQQWHLNRLDITNAHKITHGEGVTVAVIDSGVDHRHPDLKGALLKGKTFVGDSPGGWEDTHGHGTAMASLIAGHGHGTDGRDGVLGIAPSAKVLPVRVGRVRSGPPYALGEGIVWAADSGADIINVSLRGTDIEELRDAVNHAVQKGAVIVSSAGNTPDGDDSVGAPAAYPGVVAVSGTDQDHGFASASVSGPEVVLAAPATEIMAAHISQRGSYFASTGTSNSAAIVSGVAALIKSKYPDMDAANVINRLIATADDRGPEGRDPKYGYGIVNPVNALTAEVPKVDANPLLPNAPTSTASVTPSAVGPEAETGMGVTGIILTAITVLAGLAVIVAVAAAIRGNRQTEPHP